jgi:hypothetical protein
MSDGVPVVGQPVATAGHRPVRRAPRHPYEGYDTACPVPSARSMDQFTRSHASRPLLIPSPSVAEQERGHGSVRRPRSSSSGRRRFSPTASALPGPREHRPRAATGRQPVGGPQRFAPCPALPGCALLAPNDARRPHWVLMRTRGAPRQPSDALSPQKADALDVGLDRRIRPGAGSGRLIPPWSSKVSVGRSDAAVDVPDVSRNGRKWPTGDAAQHGDRRRTHERAEPR